VRIVETDHIVMMTLCVSFEKCPITHGDAKKEREGGERG
jgi:hypothetical protein